MRRTLGTAVFSGMLGVTLFGIFLTPVFFYVIESASCETPLFASARTRRHAGYVLALTVTVLTLGLPWILAWLLGPSAGGPAATIWPSAHGGRRQRSGARHRRGLGRRRGRR